MRRYIFFSMLLLGGVLYAVWRIQYHGAELRLILDPPPLPLPTPASLAAPVSIDVRDLPFHEAVERLAAQHNAPVVINTNELLSNGVDIDKPISLSVADVSLYSAVNHLLRQLNSANVIATIRNGELHITTKNDWETAVAFHDTRLYAPPITRLYGYHDQPSVLPEWNSAIRYEAWHEAGGALTAPREVHEHIQWILDRIEESEPHTSCEPIYSDGPYATRNDRIRRQLASRIDLDLSGLHLTEAAETVSEAANVPVVIEWRYVNMLGMMRNATARHAQFRNERLDVILRLVLARHGLDFYVADDALVLTQGAHANELRFDAFYPASDLLDSFATATPSTEMLSLLDHPIKMSGTNRSENPLAFFAYGYGPPPPIPMAIEPGGFLVASLTRFQHDELMDCLNTLRQEKFPFKSTPLRHGDSPTLERMLDSPVALEADESLEAFVERLKQECDINIWIDPVISNAARLDVNGRTAAGSLAESIETLLSPLGLTALPYSNTLVITNARSAVDYYCGEWYRLRFAAQAAHNGTEQAIHIFGTWLPMIVGKPVAATGSGVASDLVYIKHHPAVQDRVSQVIHQLNNGLVDSMIVHGPDETTDTLNAHLVITPIADLNLGLRNESGRFNVALADSIGILSKTDPDRTFVGPPTVLGDYVFTYDCHDLQSRVAKTITQLEWAFVRPPAPNQPWRIVVQSNIKYPGVDVLAIAYDVRGLNDVVTDSAHRDLEYLLSRACPAIRPDGHVSGNDHVRFIVIPGLLVVQADLDTHMEVRHVIELVRNTPHFAQALRLRGMDDTRVQMSATWDDRLTEALLTTLVEVDDPIERRLAAMLLPQRFNPTDSIKSRLFDALRLVQSTNDDELIRWVCNLVPNDAVSAEQIATALRESAHVTQNDDTLDHIIHALGRLGNPGANVLLDWLVEEGLKSGSSSGRHQTIRIALEQYVHCVLDSVGDPPFFDVPTLTMLRRVEHTSQGVTSAVKSKLDHGQVWSSLMPELPDTLNGSSDRLEAIHKVLVEQGVIDNERTP